MSSLSGHDVGHTESRTVSSVTNTTGIQTNFGFNYFHRDVNVLIEGAEQIPKRLHYDVPHPPTLYTGRTEQLCEITKLVKNYSERHHEKPNSNSLLAVVHGNAGVGKSSTVQEFLHRNENVLEFFKFNCLYINAESRHTAYRSLTQACHSHFPNLNVKNLSESEALQVCYSHLCDSPTLIVFDAASCATSRGVFGLPESIRDLLCKSVTSSQYKPIYIVTTRVAAAVAWEVNGYDCEFIELGPMTQSESFDYMVKAVPRLKAHAKACKDIAKYYHYLPIALELAVSQMKFEFEIDPEYNPADFLKRVAGGSAPLPAQMVDVEDLYEKVNRLWYRTLSLLKRIPKIGPHLTQLLDLVSLLCSTGVDLKFLQHIASRALGIEDIKVFQICLHMLKEYSAVKTTPGNVVYMHVLMRESLRKRLQTNRRYLSSTTKQLAEAMLSFELNQSNAPSNSLMIDNCHEVVCAIIEYLEPVDLGFCRRCASYFFEWHICLSWALWEATKSGTDKYELCHKLREFMEMRQSKAIGPVEAVLIERWIQGVDENQFDPTSFVFRQLYKS